MKLTHLCVADDLLLFCNGDFKSIYTLLQGFEMFSHASGLEVNKNKSEVYFAAMKAHEIQRVTDVSGFKVGTLPFRYLGVPIATTKLKAGDCQLMIERMVSRVRVWSTRHLSLAARIQLVNSVLMSIHVYWGQIFVIPKAVLKEVNSIFRCFLWSGTHNDTNPGVVKWPNLCNTEDTGGLDSETQISGI